MHFFQGYYGKGAGGYSFFATRDASQSFINGEFNEEGLKSTLLDFEGRELYSLRDWASFYDKHEEYFFVGLLVGEYYDEEGKPTAHMNAITQKIEIFEEEKKLRDEKKKKK